MSIKFNEFNNGYNNYNFVVGKGVQTDSKEVKKADEKDEVKDSVFRGLEDDTDLLTRNAQYLYGVQLGKFTAEDKNLADSTNAILASLGFDYKVSPAQVASVTNGVNTVVLPNMKLAEDGAVEAHIKDPNGPFADLFA